MNKYAALKSHSSSPAQGATARQPNTVGTSKYDALKSKAVTPSALTLHDVDFFIIDAAQSSGHAITKNGRYLQTPETKGDPAIRQNPALRGKESPALEALDPLYRECFPIEEEQQAIEDSAANLDRNSDEAFQKGLPAGCAGAKEAWLYARDKKTGEIVGGINFNTQAGSNITDAEGQRLVDGHSVIIYSFVKKEYRARDLFTLLLDAHDKASSAFIEDKLNLPRGSGKVLAWCEQTDTGLISAEDHERDAIHSCTRSDIFEKRGFRSIRSTDGTQVIYNQPDTAVANGDSPARIVNRRVRPVNCSLGTHPRALDKEGIAYFLASSFPEGTSLNAEVHANMQMSLSRPEPVRLLPPGLFKSLGKVLTPKALQLIASDPAYKEMPLAMVAFEALKQPVTTQAGRVESKAFRQTLMDMKTAFENFYGMKEPGIRAYVAEALSDPRWKPLERTLKSQRRAGPKAKMNGL